ncbi:hypothetical protein D9M73_202800 [compost metagenome]
MLERYQELAIARHAFKRRHPLQLSLGQRLIRHERPGQADAHALLNGPIRQRQLVEDRGFVPRNKVDAKVAEPLAPVQALPGAGVDLHQVGLRQMLQRLDRRDIQ